MPVVALSERGLAIDALSDEPFVVPSEAYALSNDRIISVRRETVDFIDPHAKKIVGSAKITGYSEIKVSKDGRKVAVLCFTGKLFLFVDQEQILLLEDIRRFSVSDEFLIASSPSKCFIFRHGSIQPAFTANSHAEVVYALNSFVIYLVRSEESYSIMFFKDSSPVELLTRPNIYRMVVEASPNELSSTIVVDVEYTKDSYYADSVLYLLWTGDKIHDEKGEPVLEKETPDFQLFLYSSLKMIHIAKFLGNDAFFVCFGPQPANLRLYAEKGRQFSAFPKGIRNRVSFSADRTRILNAGLGNLPGSIEVSENGATTCKFEKLGTSLAEWLPDGTHFILATTNYFKSDNGITLYDYYGQVIKELPYESLAQVSVYGSPEKPTVLEAPKERNIAKPAAIYVPPHLQQEANNKPVAKAVAKQTQKKSSPPKKTKEELEKEIKLGEELKKRLAAGEDLTIEDQKKVFLLKSLLEDYEKMK